MTSIAIEYKGATKIYSSSHLGKVTKVCGLDSLNLKISKGEVFGILGLNGAGKTTSIKLLFGLIFPTSGTISILENKAGSDSAKRKIGYLPELPYFYSYLTPLESLRFYARLSGMTKKEIGENIEKTLKKVGLLEHKDKKLSGFSKGMLQRMGLAQALLHNPDILVLDEPVSGLDPLAVYEIRDIFLKLKEEGKTIFLSSHSISEVEKICDRVGILKSGKLVATISQNEWSQAGLEKLFIETVKSQ
jgi:ABC-2 type transport system ATP-binding protein